MNVTKFELQKSGIFDAIHSFLCDPPQINDERAGMLMIARIVTMIDVFGKNDDLNRLINTLESNIHYSDIM
jgi:hypothetical protein